MSHSVKITTPIPSPEDVAFSLGVSRRRLDDLLALVDRGATNRSEGSGLRLKEKSTKRAFKKATSPGSSIEKRGRSSR
jgi:hypothetical protein